MNIFHPLLGSSVRAVRSVVLFAVLLCVGPEGALAQAKDATPAAKKTDTGKGFSLFLADGTVIACVKAPVFAFGRVVYKTTDGIQHVLSQELVNVARTRSHLGTVTRAAGKKRAAADLSARRKAPDFVAKMPGAVGTVKLSDFVGKVVLIDFWATWCGPCRTAMPDLRRISEKYADQDFQVMGVSLDSNRPKFQDYITKQRLNWPHYYDGKKWQNVVSRAYGVGSIPSMVLIDKQGRIAKKKLRGRALEKAIEALIAEPYTGE